MSERKRKKQAFNPYLPGYEYIPDGEPRVYGGRIYVYGSHDRFGALSFCENDYVLWSSPEEDPGDWRYEGVIFRRTWDPMNREGKYPLFAPDMEKGADGRYYLYYAPAGMEAMGAAVSKTPVGPFKFLGHIETKNGGVLGRGEGEGIPFDPGIFVDDGGQAYLYYGFAPGSESGEEKRKEGPYAVLLEDDMHTVKEGPYPVTVTDIPEKGHEFFEASSMRKINGKYYFIYSSQNSHELCWSIGNSPLGPFRYGGVLLSNGDIGYKGRKAEDRVNYTGNNHGSLAEINGKWYVFGHRMTNYTPFSRQGIAEPVEFDPDGGIRQAELTSCGLNGEPLRGYGTYEARIACGLVSGHGAIHIRGLETLDELRDPEAGNPVFTQDGEDREANPDQHIANMHDGSRACFKYFNLEDPVWISVVTRGGEGEMIVTTEPDGNEKARIPLTEGKDWHNSQEILCTGPAGKQALYFTYRGEGAVDFLSFRLALEKIDKNANVNEEQR